MLCGPRVGGGGQLIVHVLDCGITDDTWVTYERAIRQLAEKIDLDVKVVRHIIDMNQFAHLKGWTNGSKSVWTRLLIPTILSDVDHCVYSDADMFFVSDPIEMLNPVQQNSGIILAGHLHPNVEDTLDAVWYHQKGLQFEGSKYLCAGLVSMDLKAFRAENLVEKCFDFVRNNPDIPLLDQTTLNEVCMGRKGLFSDGWGLFAHECHAFEGRIKAIHLAGCQRWPWETCQIFQNVAWLNLTRDEFAIWFEFEKRILGSPLPSVIKQPIKLRIQAACFLMLERLANLLKFRIGQGRFQKIVSAHDVQTSALSNARKEIFSGI